MSGPSDCRSFGRPPSSGLVRAGPRSQFVPYDPASSRTFCADAGFPVQEGLNLQSRRESNVAATDRLLRPVFGMYRVEWPNDPGVEFHLSHGDWVRLLRSSDFEIEDLIEVTPSAGRTTE